MRPRSSFGRRCFSFLLAALLAAALHRAGGQEIDAGPATMVRASKSRVNAALRPDLRLERMLLLLQPSDEQKKKLNNLLAAQQTPGNPGFHQWVAPADFANSYALSAADAATVAAWLRNNGFNVAALPTSRGWIEFSGTVSQVQHAFGVTVVAAPSSPSTPSQARYALSGQIRLPSTINSFVNGLVSLDGTISSSAATRPAMMNSAAIAILGASPSLSGAPAITPALLAESLHLTSPAGNAGAGESIAVVSRSNVRVQDFAAFRKSFGLPEAALEIKLSGDDPGRTSDEAAAIASASWAGAVAPQAGIVLVAAATTNATDGIDLALATAIDGSFAHTVSVGYTNCESGMSAAHQAFYAALYRQAAAEGIAVIAATGDSGAAACHSPDDATPVRSGWAVNALASTPWNTAVGSAAFSSDASSVNPWQPLNGSDLANATGGGASTIYAAPQWQSALGVPASDPASAPSSAAGLNHHRYLPDVSLPTLITGSNEAGPGLAFCFSGEVENDRCRVVTGGGSGASASIFAGVAALLAQKYGPQGNLAPNLYALNRAQTGSTASKSSQSFLDVATGGAKLRCVAGSPNCVAAEAGIAEIGFAAGPGYDLASGLGSINVQSLIQNWTTAEVIGTAPVSVVMTNTGSTTYNPSAVIALGAKVLSESGSTIPTGTVQFYDKTVTADTGLPVTLDATGTATYSESGQFTQGGHDIEAIYSGDSTYESATSQPVVITVEPSPTALTVVPSTTTPGAGSTFTVTGTIASTNPGASAPTGTLTVNLDGVSQGTAILATTGTGTAAVTSASVSVIAPAAGGHAVQGLYSGDINYTSSTSPSVTITIVKTATVTTLAATPSTLSSGVPESFTAVVGPLVAATGVTYTLTGTVSFYDGTTLLGTAAVTGNTAILTSITLAASVVHTITAVYSGDTSYSASTSAPLILQPVLLPVTVVLTSSSGTLAPGQSANLTATVTPVNTPLITAEQNPTGTVYFYAGTTLLGSATLVTGVGDSSTAKIVVPVLPAGAYVLTAVYAGDLTYGPGTSNSLNLQVEDFTISCTPNSTSVVQGGAVSVTCSVASLGGLTGPIQVACAEQNPPQVGAMGCSFNPDVLEGNASTTMTVTTTAGSSLQASLDRSPNFRGPHEGYPALWPAAAGGAALALAGLLFLPFGGVARRARMLRSSSRNLLALTLLLAGLVSAGLGCTNSVTLTNPATAGTPLGVHTIKVTAAANLTPPTVTVSHYSYVTINVTPINGQ